MLFKVYHHNVKQKFSVKKAQCHILMTFLAMPLEEKLIAHSQPIPC